MTLAAICKLRRTDGTVQLRTTIKISQIVRSLPRISIYTTHSQKGFQFRLPRQQSSHVWDLSM